MQFVETPVATDTKIARFNRLLEWLPAHLEENLRVADLARQAGMSVHSFQRRFRETTGSTPGDWLIRRRVDRARHLAQTTALTIDEIAVRSGLGAAETLRHHFRRLVGTTPTAYRRTFGRFGGSRTGRGRSR